MCNINSAIGNHHKTPTYRDQLVQFMFRVPLYRTRCTSNQNSYYDKAMGFSEKIKNMSNENPIIYIIEKARHLHVKEVEYDDTLVERYTCKQEIITESLENIKKAIKAKATPGRSKYLTYLLINPGLEAPKIYSKVHNRIHCHMLAKFRTS